MAEGHADRAQLALLGAIARALRLDHDERDHLLRLGGLAPASSARRTDHVDPALMRVLDRLDTPAQVMSDAGLALAQNGAEWLPWPTTTCGPS